MTRMRILIAEDSKTQVKILEKQLSALYDLTTVFDGAEAIRKLGTGELPQVIILDIRMPRVDGFKVMEHIDAEKLPVKVLVITSALRQSVEAKALRLGTDYILTKPLDMEALHNLLARWSKEIMGNAEIKLQEDLTGNKLPFTIVDKCCYICGYEKVKIFMPIKGAYVESWENGLFPVYTSMKGYGSWDFFKTIISICPFCFFASSDPEDFSENPSMRFPYEGDAKKILSRTIGTRKKMVAESKEIDLRFNPPDRDVELVIDSLKLAEKCMNGLVLGGKSSAHALLGFYQVLLGSINRQTQTKYYDSALECFQNQLRITNTSPEIISMSNYFLMVLNMAIGKSEVAKEVMKKVVDWYSDRGNEGIGSGEKLWLKRLSDVWNNGLLPDTLREIE
ncbi:MAG: DUF2225 domain-containing protein [Fibrobacteria bacterium]|nr:DUF2225 domain-containing protein [Fibrobacteria bacterium]